MNGLVMFDERRLKIALVGLAVTMLGLALDYGMLALMLPRVS